MPYRRETSPCGEAEKTICTRVHKNRMNKACQRSMKRDGMSWLEVVSELKSLQQYSYELMEKH